MYLVTNGQVVLEQGIAPDHEVLIERERIKGVYPAGTVDHREVDAVIDANGGYISPGFIDIHADYIETMACPRPTSIMDFGLSLRETERVLLGNGITTMFHSLSLYKRDQFTYKAIRNPDNVKKFVELIHATHTEQHLIRHRFHARFEIDNIEEVESLKTYIKEGKVHLVSFMDHTPGQGQYRDLEMYRHTLKGYKDLTDAEIDNIIAENQSKETMTLDMIKEIADLALRHNIAVASHDDDSLEKIDLVQNFGATISEFPITLAVAQEARQRGMYTIAGAPNILLGGSHSGNLSAATAIEAGAIDILCSDYYPAAMLHSVFIMHEQYNQDLGDMFNLVTLNAAKAVRMDGEIGSIKAGKRADLLVIEKVSGSFPAVTAAIVDGKLSSRIHYRV